MTFTFELQVNGRPVTKVSVINKGPYGEDEGLYVYEWNAWRCTGPRCYAAGELVHRRADGAEELAIKVLTQYRQIFPSPTPDQTQTGQLGHE